MTNHFVLHFPNEFSLTGKGLVTSEKLKVVSHEKQASNH